jgi:hypothetical protein
MDANRLVNVAGRNRAVPLEDDVLDKVDLGVKIRGPFSGVNPRIRFFLLQAGLSHNQDAMSCSELSGYMGSTKEKGSTDREGGPQKTKSSEPIEDHLIIHENASEIENKTSLQKEGEANGIKITKKRVGNRPAVFS